MGVSYGELTRRVKRVQAGLQALGMVGPTGRHSNDAGLDGSGARGPEPVLPRQRRSVGERRDLVHNNAQASAVILR